MSKKVLITGSAGFVGHHFVDYFLEKTDWDIVGLDSFKHRGDSMRVQTHERYQIYTCDLTTPISYRLASQIGEIDYLLSVASESHVDRSITDPVPFVKNNVDLILNVLEYARVVKPKVFLQISTDEVYGAAPEGIDHQEWSSILPSNPYSASKAAQEAIAISYWRTFGVPLILTNTMNMLGKRQDPEKYLPMLIHRIAHDLKVIVHGTPEYIGKRHYLDCTNLADAVHFLITKTTPTLYHDDPKKIILPDRYNIVGDVELDNLQLAEAVAAILQKNLNVEFLDFHQARPGHDRRYSLDGSKIKNLGWSAPISLEQTLNEIIEYTLKNPIWLK